MDGRLAIDKSSAAPASVARAIIITSTQCKAAAAAEPECHILVAVAVNKRCGVSHLSAALTREKEAFNEAISGHNTISA